MVIQGRIDILGEKEEIVTALLEEHGLQKVKGSYEYLMSLHMRSLTKERSEMLIREAANLREELNTLSGKSPESLWLEELEELQECLNASIPKL